MSWLVILAKDNYNPAARYNRKTNGGNWQSWSLMLCIGSFCITAEIKGRNQLQSGNDWSVAGGNQKSEKGSGSIVRVIIIIILISQEMESIEQLMNVKMVLYLYQLSTVCHCHLQGFKLRVESQERTTELLQNVLESERKVSES